jgi:predicted nucleic acid-binding protein
MPKVVISDSSVLIVFSKIEHLDLLKKVYTEVYTTPEVIKEFGEEIPEWIIVEAVKDKKYQESLETQIDKGEASAIALAKENDDCLILLDDLKARKLAAKLNLKFTGSLGIIHKAKQLGIVEKVKPAIDKLIENNFRISVEVVSEILRLNDE